MGIGSILFNGFIVAFFFFIFSVNIFGRFMGDKGTLIASSITSVVTAIIAVLIPEDLRYYGMIGFAILFVLTGLSQFFRKR